MKEIDRHWLKAIALNMNPEKAAQALENGAWDLALIRLCEQLFGLYPSGNSMFMPFYATRDTSLARYGATDTLSMIAYVPRSRTVYPFLANPRDDLDEILQGIPATPRATKQPLAAIHALPMGGQEGVR
jgi:hypothetical protein